MVTSKKLKVSMLCAALACAVPSASWAAFTDVSAAAGISVNGNRGAGWADYDQDTCPDLFVSGESQSNLFRNNCDGTFSDVSAAAGISGPAGGWGVAWADYDGDGDQDVYVSNGAGANVLYQNDGDGTFHDVAALAGVDDTSLTAGASWADYDGDGDLDLFVANRFAGDLSDRLYSNNGNKTFTDVAVAAGVVGAADRKTFSGAWFDYDANGTIDLYLSVDFGDDVLYSNNGDGTFTDVSAAAGIADPQHGMGVAIGDINGDGCLDVFSSNNTQGDPSDAEHGPSAIYVNNCDGTFTNEATERGLKDRAVVEWGANMVDYDNDGDVDLAVVAGGMLTVTGEPNVLYETDCAGDFCDLHDVSDSMGVAQSSAAFGSAWDDYDGDGDLDWFVANVSGGPSVLYRNDNSVGHYIKVQLEGVVSNLQGIGARVELEQAGRTQVRVIQAGQSYSSSERPIAFFGLGVKDKADTVRVHWPAGAVTTVTDVAADQMIVLVEEDTPDPSGVSGTVFDPDGAPTFARVQIRDEANALIEDQFTDENGNYEITNLEPGSYGALAIKPGFRKSPRVPFELVEGDGVVVDLTLRQR